MLNHFGKDSELYIKTKVKNGITVLEDSFFTAPYKIAKPFFDDKRGVMDIMVMSASAGIMEGDYYRVNMELGEGSRVIMYGQSYTKIHRMKDGYARQHNRFYLEEGAFLDYTSKPTIPFGQSSFESNLECYLENSSTFLYSDILACGREKRGERFEFKSYRNRNKVYYKEELIFLDNQMLLPNCQNLTGIGFFEGYTHQATLIYFNDALRDNLIERLYDILESSVDIDFGISKTKKYGIIVRILGNSSDYLEKILINLKEEINTRI